MLKLVVSISILVFGVFAAHFSGSTKDGHFGRAGQKKSRKNCVSRINDEPRSCLCFQSQGKNTFSNVNTSKKKQEREFLLEAFTSNMSETQQSVADCLFSRFCC